MPYKYIGRKTDFKGKTLWEILGNLKNFGVGRIVTRSRFERYAEPTYMKIVKVDALPCPKKQTIDDMRKVVVLVEKTFRGKKLSELARIESASYKTDYKLIPLDEETVYCKGDVKKEFKILPKYTVFPPLMRELIIREMKAKGTEVKEEPKLEVFYREDRYNKYKIAEDGEKASFEHSAGIGTTVATQLYKGLKLRT